MRKGRGELKKISDLFGKYTKILIAPQKSVITAFVEVVEDVLGIKVEYKKISYSTGSRTISLNVGGPLKSEIQIHKNEILSHMKGRLGEKNAPKTIL